MLKVTRQVWNIPTYDNKHNLPYGYVDVSDGKEIRRCTIKYENGYMYTTFKRKRYGLVNKGSLYLPNLCIVDYKGGR